MIKPRKKAPELEINLINGTNWKLSEQDAESFTMIVFYRGLHCPVCKKYLKELSSKIDDFKEKGVNVIAVSMDTEKRAKKSAEEWETGDLPIGYELSRDTAENWDLYISKAEQDAEPEIFSEPGLFLIKPDNTVYCAAIQTMPFTRPDLDQLLKSIDFVKEKDYPARGEQ